MRNVRERYHGARRENAGNVTGGRPNDAPSRQATPAPLERYVLRPMFRWCAYCMRFVGETAPFDDFSPTHGLCASCEDDPLAMTAEALDRLRPLVAFHRELLALATTLSSAQPFPSPRGLLERAETLGVRPIDFMVGLLQPLLYEVGRLWSSNELEPATEARFTTYVEAVLELLEVDQLHRRVARRGPPLILVSAPGNAHTVGIRMLGLRLREEGRDVRVVTQPIDPSHLAHLAAIVEASRIGVSLSDPAQLAHAREVVTALRRRSLATRVSVGGFGTRGMRQSDLPDAVELGLDAEGARVG